MISVHLISRQLYVFMHRLTSYGTHYILYSYLISKSNINRSLLKTLRANISTISACTLPDKRYDNRTLGFEWMRLVKNSNFHRFGLDLDWTIRPTDNDGRSSRLNGISKWKDFGSMQSTGSFNVANKLPSDIITERVESGQIVTWWYLILVVVSVMVCRWWGNERKRIRALAKTMTVGRKTIYFYDQGDSHNIWNRFLVDFLYLPTTSLDILNRVVACIIDSSCQQFSSGK